MSALDAILSPLVGLVPRVDSLLAAAGDAVVPTSVCTLASDERVVGAVGHVGMTSGSGRTRRTAAAAALGEAVERYSASYVPEHTLVTAAAAELGPEAVDPGRFALFADFQHEQPGFPFVRFDRETRVPWTRGMALRDGAPAWLPAELVYLGDPAGDVRIGYATSSGAACAPDRRVARLRGLLELVERDAFMLVWRNRLSLPLLEWRGHRKLRELDDRHFAPAGLEYAAVDLSPIHGIPSVLGVVRTPGGRGGIGVGAGTARTAGQAWWKALAEAFATHGAGRRLAWHDGDTPLEADDVDSFDAHIRWHGRAGRAAASAFLDASAARVDVRDVESLPSGVDEQIDAVLQRIEAAGSSAYAVDVTSPDVASLGLHVEKTLAPELCSLDVSHRARLLGGRRIREGAYRLGLAPRPFELDELNPDPHPFP